MPPTPCSPLYRGPGDLSGGAGRGCHGLAATSRAVSGAGEQSARVLPGEQSPPPRLSYLLTPLSRPVFSSFFTEDFSTSSFSCERVREQGEG